MRSVVGVLLVVGLCVSPGSTEEKGKKVAPVLNFTMNSLAGKPVELGRYQGKVVLMVNVASQCGHTPQYKELQTLHDKYAKDGLVVLGFPSNDFGEQEPGTNAEIAEFCKKNYGVTFDMFAKVGIKGKEQCPLYRHLTSKETNPKFGGPVQWNFEKFLINRQGEIVARYESDVNPDAAAVVQAVEAALKKK